MKKTVLFVAIMTIGFAEAGLKNGPAMTQEELREKRYRRTGGMLKVPNVQKGAVTYINAQSKVPQDWLGANATRFAEEIKIDVNVVEGEFNFANPQTVGEATLFVIDDVNMPSLLIAPEQHWAMINVAPLATGRGEKETFLRARVEKELTRGFCMLCGATASNYPKSITGCVTNSDQLDKFSDAKLPEDVIARFAEYLKGYGIVQYDTVSYRTACEQGWAPEPTNEVQKVIWEKVKAEQSESPSNPIRIKPGDKPKGK